MSITMYDSIAVDPLRGVASTSGQAVAGYVDGRFADYQQMVAAFPKDHHLSIAVSAADDADCLDIETGDAQPEQAPAWVKRQLARGVWRPCLYMDLATFSEVSRVMEDAGIQRERVRIWTAHFTGVAHIEPGSDATQWTNHADGRNLDESLCLEAFFPPPPAPPPQPVPRGIAGYAGTVDLHTGHWTKPHGTAGVDVHLGKDGNGQWDVDPLPAEGDYWAAKIRIRRGH